MNWLMIAGILIIADIVVIASIYSWRTRHHRPVVGHRMPGGVPECWGTLSRDHSLVRGALGQVGPGVPIEYWEQFFEDGSAPRIGKE